MANDEEKNNDFYKVLGLKKECTAVELKNAYKECTTVAPTFSDFKNWWREEEEEEEHLGPVVA